MKTLTIIIIIAITAIFGFYIIQALGAKTTGNTIAENTDNSKITLQVNIPCEGHAGLITYELQKLEGISSVNFKYSNLFDVYYDSSKISKQEILNAEIFREYPAKII